MKTENTNIVWDFVEKFYPNYTNSNEIAENDDLHKIVNGEINGDAETMYFEKFNEIKENTNEMLDDEEIKERVLLYFSILKDASDAKVYEEAIKGFLESQKPPTKTFYLFGEDVVRSLNDEGFDSALELIEANESYGTFIFIEGETKSHELAEAIQGWNDYAIITEEEYNKL